MKHTTKKLLSLLLVLSMLVGLFAVTAVAAPAASSAEVYDLRVDDLTAPVGIDNANPVFSWKMKSDAIGAAQTAYSIIVTSEKGDTMWNTGWTESDKSVAIAYNGADLAASTEYTVQVAIKDQTGAETAYASTTFETGLMSETPFADASWISMGTGAGSPATSYTIDFDFIINNDNQGFSFGMQNTGTFVMWQVNTYDGPHNNAGGDVVLLRPHFKSNGSWVGYPGLAGSTVKAVDVSKAIGYVASTLVGKQVHERIVVDGANIKTYFGGADATYETPTADLQLADDYTYTSTIPLGKIGFRHSYDAGGSHEVASYDNIHVVDGEGNVVYHYDFSDGKTGFTTTNGTVSVVDGWLKVGSDKAVSEQIYMQGENSGSLPGYRKSIDVADGLVSAKLYTSGLGVYESYINGERVGRKMDDGSIHYDELKPGFTEMGVRKFYNTYDVTWMLQAGQENVLSAVVSSGWWSGGVARNFGKTTGYLAKLILTYQDGTTKTIVTDNTWKAEYAAAIQNGTGIFDGERYDARVDLSWMKPGFDDSAWGNVTINTEFSGKISAWSGVPITVREDLERSAKAITVFKGATGAAANQHGKINVLRTYNDGDEITLNPGETLLVDFGQNASGWEAFTLNTESGTKINVRHGEMLNDGNGATSRGNDGPEGSIYNANYRSATANTVYIANGFENESYHPTQTFYGFRYIEITADNTVTFSKITAQTVTSSQEDTGYLTTSDKDVNQLVSNARWGMYSNYLSVPTDCPQRDERQGWTADTQNFSEAGMFLGYSKTFLEKFMEDMRDCQASNGAYPGIAPTGNYSGASWGALGWADAGVIVPYFLYEMYGDTTVITENWESMKKFMDVYMASTNKMGGNHSYGDWLAYESNDDTIKDMLGVSYYAWDAMLMSKMAAAIGLTSEAERYMAVYEDEKAVYQSKYVNTDGTLKRGEQSVCLYALFLDLLPDENSVAKVTEQLITNIEGKGNRLQTGFLGTEVIMHTLTKIGRSDVAYKLLLQHDNPSWLYSVDQGATTIWERWNSYTLATGFGDVGMNSFNHYSYGSVASWMFRGMAGIGYDLENPGFKHIILAPHPDQLLKKVEASYESVYGTIVSKMNYVDDSWTYECTVPANTTATIQLPVENIDTLKIAGKAVADLTAADGLTYKGYADGIATFEAVAGSYSFATSVAAAYNVKIAVKSDGDVPPVEGTIYVNGKEAAYGLPATLSLKQGDVVSGTIKVLNDVDYTVANYTVGDAVVTEGAELNYTVTGDAEITANVKWIGLESLATGKPVTASQVNTDWKAGNLTDGILSYLGGTNGWSSASQGTNKTFNEVTAVIDLGTKAEFNRFHLYPRNLPSQSVDVGVMNCPVAYTFYVSDDNQNWTAVYSTTNGPVTNGYAPVVIELDEAVSGRYVKFGCTAVNNGDENGTVYVQLSELGIYKTVDTGSKQVKLSLSKTADVVPMTASVKVNGEEVATTLPNTVTVKNGDTITVSAALLNAVDYEIVNWTAGDTVVSEDGSLTYKVNGDADLTLNVKWIGYDSLATGKSVTAAAVNGDWKAANLTDGVLSHFGGTNGWSSNALGSATTFNEVTAVIDLGESAQFNRFHIYPRNVPTEAEDVGVMNCPVAYTFYVSDDNQNWTPVYSTTEGPVTNGYEPVVVKLDKAVSGRYVKLGVTAVNHGDEHGTVYVQLSELGIYLVQTQADLDQAAADAVDALIDAIGEVTLDSKDAIDAARNAYEELTETQKDLVTKLDDLKAAEDAYDALLNKPVRLIVTGEAETNLYAESVKYTVSAKDMVNMATVKLTIALDPELLTDVMAAPAAEGWYIIGQTYQDGILTVVAGNNAGVTGDGDLLTITAKPAGKTGDVTVKVTKAQLAGYEGETETFLEVNLDGASATTKVSYSIYDVNHDGVVDQLDLTRAQRFYGTDDKVCDVNGDGEVNIGDLIMILNNFTEPY